MKQFLKTNFKDILIVGIGFGIGLFVIYLAVYLFTPKPQMPELDKYKLEQLNKDIDLILKFRINTKILTKVQKSYFINLIRAYWNIPIFNITK